MCVKEGGGGGGGGGSIKDYKCKYLEDLVGQSLVAPTNLFLSYKLSSHTTHKQYHISSIATLPACIN